MQIIEYCQWCGSEVYEEEDIYTGEKVKVYSCKCNEVNYEEE